MTDLSIFLIREFSEQHNQVVRPEISVEHHTISLPGGQQWDLYIKRAAPKVPKWARFFQGYVPDLGIFGRSSAPGALLLVPAADRLFGITFGQTGRSILYPDCWEDRFGFKVTINAVDHKKLRSIDKDRLDAEPRRGREQTARARDASYFGVDPSRDIIRAVDGKPRNTATLGKHLTGRDHLHVTGATTSLPELPALLERYYGQFLSTNYKENFEWVDHISHVTDKEVIQWLELELVDLINKRELDKCMLAVPEVVEWDNIYGFKYSHAAKIILHNELSLDDLMATMPESIDMEGLRRRVIRVEDADGTNIYNWPTYRCLVVEVEDGSGTYLLNAGSWFRISTDFVSEVNQAVASVVLASPDYLTEYRSIDTSEGAYNERMANLSDGEVALMDKKNVKCPTATSPIEFCDLYHKNKDIVHVKKYGGSSVLSHLFFQGRNSAEAFLKDPGFREALNEKLPKSHRIKKPAINIKPEDYTVIFAVISGKKGELSLPFFSRLSLRLVVEQLEYLRFRTALAKIDMTDKAVMLAKKSKKKLKKTF